MSISLNKDYENYMQSQIKNPNSLYTDPQFLQAIRDDVNKILKKRKLKVTSIDNSSQINPNHVYINSKKVDSLKSQPLTCTNNTNYMGQLNKISQFR